MTRWNEIGAAGALACAVVLGGCATAGASSPVTGHGADAATVGETRVRDDARVTALQTDVSELQRELQAREQRIDDLQSRIDGQGQVANSALFPPKAKPGQCFARVLTPEQYRTSEERVLVKEESELVDVIPAQYEDIQERVLIKEASTRLEIIPAEYETVTEQVLVKPATQKIVQVPTTFRTVTEEVLDKPAYTVWKRGAANTFANPVLSQTVNATGEVMCLVEVPATYKTITRSVVDVPAHTKTVEIPAEYKTLEKRVLKRPASTREVTIPAEYETVSVRKIVKPAQERRSKVPAEYRTVTKSEKIADAELAWQQVLCDVNATSSNIVALQKALQAKGYSVGPIDGVLGAQTISAVSDFAKSKGIPHGANYVPVEVLQALDVEI